MFSSSRWLSLPLFLSPHLCHTISLLLPIQVSFFIKSFSFFWRRYRQRTRKHWNDAYVGLLKINFFNVHYTNRHFTLISLGWYFFMLAWSIFFSLSLSLSFFLSSYSSPLSFPSFILIIPYLNASLPPFLKLFFCHLLMEFFSNYFTLPPSFSMCMSLLKYVLHWHSNSLPLLPSFFLFLCFSLFHWLRFNYFIASHCPLTSLSLTLYLF